MEAFSCFFPSSHIKPNQGWGFFRGIQRLALCGLCDLCVRSNPIKPYQAKSRSGPFFNTVFELLNLELGTPLDVTLLRRKPALGEKVETFPGSRRWPLWVLRFATFWCSLRSL